jgi:hypothetical protein
MLSKAWWRRGARSKRPFEIARDVAKKLIEAQSGPNITPLPAAREEFDYPLIIAG